MRSFHLARRDESGSIPFDDRGRRIGLNGGPSLCDGVSWGEMGRSRSVPRRVGRSRTRAVWLLSLSWLLSSLLWYCCVIIEIYRGILWYHC